MQDAGRSPLRLLPDDRASRSRAVDPIAGDVHAVRRDGHERCGAGKIKAALERRGVTASGRRVGNIMCISSSRCFVFSLVTKYRIGIECSECDQ